MRQIMKNCRAWINSRLETGVSTSAKRELEHELEQIYALCSRIPKYKSTLFPGIILK